MTDHLNMTAKTLMTASVTPGTDEEPAPVAPRTATEALVASVWCDLLGVEQVSVTDNFFELGGHSLLATQAVFQLTDRTGTFLDLEAFFELGTVAEIAAEIDRLREAGPGLAPVAAADVYEEDL